MITNLAPSQLKKKITNWITVSQFRDCLRKTNILIPADPGLGNYTCMVISPGVSFGYVFFSALKKVSKTKFKKKIQVVSLYQEIKTTQSRPWVPHSLSLEDMGITSVLVYYWYGVWQTAHKV